MPTRPQRPCNHAGCRHLVDSGYCTEHQRARARAVEHERGSAHVRGYTRAWRKASKAFLRAHPLCCYCEANGRVTAADCVDHFIPHRGDTTLFWDVSNWRSACTPCHSAKTAREDGGFGHTRGQP